MLKLLNFLILQWFCIRLVKCTRRVYIFRGSGIHKFCSNEYTVSSWYGVAGWIVPLTGWGLSEYSEIAGYRNSSLITFGSTKRCDSVFPWMWRITWRYTSGIVNNKHA